MINTPAYTKVPHVCASMFKWIDGVGSAKASEIFTKVKGGPNAFTSVFAFLMIALTENIQSSKQAAA